MVEGLVKDLCQDVQNFVEGYGMIMKEAGLWREKGE